MTQRNQKQSFNSFLPKNIVKQKYYKKGIRPHLNFGKISKNIYFRCLHFLAFPFFINAFAEVLNSGIPSLSGLDQGT